MSDQPGLIDDITRLRDEARVKLHLASMEAKQEWEELETKWYEFSASAELAKTGEGLGQAARLLREELAEGYQRLKKAIADQQCDDRRKKINDRAYQLWEERGRPLDCPDDDWYKAEEEIR